MIRTGDWMGFIPALLYKRLFEKNEIRPRGITFHYYWSCHPFYEAGFARIPIINFEYGADEYVHEFRKSRDSKNDSRFVVRILSANR